MPAFDWTGKSGRVYTFGVFSLGDIFKPSAGVYIVCRSTQVVGGTSLEALYVGEAESLEDRLNTGRGRHDGFQRALKMGATHVCGMLVPDNAAARVGIETDLRHALNPPCNAQPVPLPPVPPAPPLRSLGSTLPPNARTLAELLKR